MKKNTIFLIVNLTLLVILFLLDGYRQKRYSSLPYSMTGATAKTDPNDPNKIAPQKIVSLSPNLTEILFELGLEKNIAAVSSDSDYPPSAGNISNIGTFWQPDTEAIIALDPNLVISLTFEQQLDTAETLKRAGYEVLTVKLENILDLFEAIEKIGKASGRAEAAKNLNQKLKDGLASIKAEFEESERVRVLWVVQHEPLRVVGSGNFVNDIIEIAGGKNVITDTIAQYPAISTEELLTSNADVIIQSAMGSENIDIETQNIMKFWQSQPDLAAVRNNRVYVIDPDITLRLGPRLTKGIDIIAKCLHNNKNE